MGHSCTTSYRIFLRWFYGEIVDKINMKYNCIYVILNLKKNKNEAILKSVMATIFWVLCCGEKCNITIWLYYLWFSKNLPTRVCYCNCLSLIVVDIPYLSSLICNFVLFCSLQLIEFWLGVFQKNSLVQCI